jgi:hypothetical protein
MVGGYEQHQGPNPHVSLALLGVDIELHDALQRIRFEHPEVGSVYHHQRQAAYVLLRREHLHAWPIEPCVEGELLQVHE